MCWIHGTVFDGMDMGEVGRDGRTGVVVSLVTSCKIPTSAVLRSKQHMRTPQLAQSSSKQTRRPEIPPPGAPNHSLSAYFPSHPTI